MMFDIVDKLPQAQHAVDRIEVNVKGNLQVDIRLFGLQHPETPYTNPVLLGKPLHDLLKIGCPELGCLSGKELLLNPVVLFNRPAKFLLDRLPILEKLFIFQ